MKDSSASIDLLLYHTDHLELGSWVDTLLESMVISNVNKQMIDQNIYSAKEMNCEFHVWDETEEESLPVQKES